MTVFDLIDSLGEALMAGQIKGESEIVLCSNVRPVDAIEFVLEGTDGFPGYIVLHDSESCQ